MARPTEKDIVEQIGYLQDDIVACRNACGLADATTAEKAEWNMRIRANMDEIRRLKALRKEV